MAEEDHLTAFLSKHQNDINDWINKNVKTQFKPTGNIFVISRLFVVGQFIAGKVAIVTGASRNLGRAFSEMLSIQGASAVVVHYNNPDKRTEAEDTATKIRDLGAKAVVEQADLTCATTNPGTVTYNGLAAGQQHTFAVSAVDTQGIKDPTPVTFSWTILTPTQAIQKLISTIDSFNLPTGTTTSLEAPLNAAITQLSHNNNAAACTQLNNFLNQVSTKQTNRQLTSQQAADLRQQATAIQSAIGCSNTASSSSPSLLPLPMP